MTTRRPRGPRRPPELFQVQFQRVATFRLRRGSRHDAKERGERSERYDVTVSRVSCVTRNAVTNTMRYAVTLSRVPLVTRHHRTSSRLRYRLNSASAMQSPNAASISERSPRSCSLRKPCLIRASMCETDRRTRTDITFRRRRRRYSRMRSAAVEGERLTGAASRPCWRFPLRETRPRPPESSLSNPSARAWYSPADPARS